VSDTEITPLSPETVARIAAGEVVERPASVAKELVENSLDAGASRVDVTVSEGGVEGVSVADDGEGMNEADARAAVREHTTSKLDDADDLRALGTLGFRGEALHTIGAVSATTIVSKREGEPGVELEYRFGEVESVAPAGRGVGTTVEVGELFANTPARRKYLGSRATEFGHVNRVVSRYALANPGVAVSLTHDGTETFATTGRGDLREALLSVYGREVAESMVEVESPGEVGVSGYVSHPETTRSSREYLAVFVNGRAVSDSVAREAIVSAYGGQLAPDRFPFAALFLDIDPESVDANVHPRKQEVRYDDEERVRETVEGAVREALIDAGLVRTRAPRGASAPGDAEIAPGDTGEADDEAESGADGTETGDGPDAPETDGTPRTRNGGAGAPPASEAATGAFTPAESGDDAEPEPAAGSDGAEPTPGGSGPESAEPTPPEEPERKFRPATRNARLPGTESETGDGDREPDFDSLPAMRVLGQLHDTYVVAETDDGLVLIDQHAADERIHYERLRERVTGESQSLVVPVELELTAGEAAVFGDALPALREVGFEAELRERTAVVGSVPAVLAETLSPAGVRDALADVLAGEAPDVSDAATDLLADLACAPAVTGNTSLAEGSVRELLSELDACENPYACPHGRPVVIELDETELAERFERDYPGHATRRPE
jgi:DNA mismatch repair protein MutL